MICHKNGFRVKSLVSFMRKVPSYSGRLSVLVAVDGDQ